MSIENTDSSYSLWFLDLALLMSSSSLVQAIVSIKRRTNFEILPRTFTKVSHKLSSESFNRVRRADTQPKTVTQNITLRTHFDFSNATMSNVGI